MLCMQLIVCNRYQKEGCFSRQPKGKFDQFSYVMMVSCECGFTLLYIRNNMVVQQILRDLAVISLKFIYCSIVCPTV